MRKLCCVIPAISIVISLVAIVISVSTIISVKNRELRYSPRPGSLYKYDLGRKPFIDRSRIYYYKKREEKSRGG